MPEWYIAIGGMYGSPYHASVYWKLYYFNGTEQDVQKVYGRLYMVNYNKKNNTKKTFMDIVEENYYEIQDSEEDICSCVAAINEEKAQEYLISISKMYSQGNDYLDGYILKDEVVLNDIKYEEEQNVIYYVRDDNTDTEFLFDKVY